MKVMFAACRSAFADGFMPQAKPLDARLPARYLAR